MSVISALPSLIALGASGMVLSAGTLKGAGSAAQTEPSGVTHISSRMGILLDLNNSDIVDPWNAGFSPGARATVIYAPSIGASGGTHRCHCVTCWNAIPARSSVASVRALPSSCTPTGRPPEEKPAGKDSAHASR